MEGYRKIMSYFLNQGNHVYAQILQQNQDFLQYFVSIRMN